MSLHSIVGTKLSLLKGKFVFNPRNKNVIVNTFINITNPISRYSVLAVDNNWQHSSAKVTCPLTLPVLNKLWNQQQRECSTNVYTCWKCGSSVEKSSVFCKTCDALQKPQPALNYFDVLGVQQKYEVNISELRTKYRRLQNMLHPDRFSNRDKEEKEISEEYSSLVNKAYSTLLQPLSRGLYMLQLKGIYIEESRVQSSPEFLMKMMERNEELDEVNGAEQLKLLDTQNKCALQKLSQKVEEALNSDNVQLAEEAIIEMKYYSSIDSKIRDLKQKKGFED